MFSEEDFVLDLMLLRKMRRSLEKLQQARRKHNEAELRVIELQEELAMLQREIAHQEEFDAWLNIQIGLSRLGAFFRGKREPFSVLSGRFT